MSELERRKVGRPIGTVGRGYKRRVAGVVGVPDPPTPDGRKTWPELVAELLEDRDALSLDCDRPR